MNRERYLANKAAAVYNNTDPTETDQSQANDTDINVIIGRFGIGRLAPGAATPPIYADLTEMPRDLRGFIETARNLETLRERLPAQLRGQNVDELLALTPAQIHGLLFPKKEEQKPVTNADKKE